MRPRFSLRTLLALTTLTALLCYWLILPTLKAQKFVAAVTAKDFARADGHLRNSNDAFLVNANEKHWGFVADARLAPWSLAQLLSGRRSISLNTQYFELDETHEIRAQLTATSFGIQASQNTTNNSSAVIDRTESVSRLDFRR